MIRYNQEKECTISFSFLLVTTCTKKKLGVGNLKHFCYLSNEEQNKIFYRTPQAFSRNTEKELLAYALGATLYMPGTRTQISNDVQCKKYIRGIYEGLTSIVICLEDSVSDHEVEQAEINVVVQLQDIARLIDSGVYDEKDLPLLFIRLRNPEQMVHIINHLGSAAHLLSGFVFPKFTHTVGRKYLDLLQDMNSSHSLSLYGMPILESQEVIYKETREEALFQIKNLLDQHFPQILNVRIGATDFSGLFGIRRSRNTIIYDIAVIRDCISDIINIFGRVNQKYVISGPVYEYFNQSINMGKSPICSEYMNQERGNHYSNILHQETFLDKENGLVGKTIIHPSQIKSVQALHVVTLEEYLDAKDIIETADVFNGVMRSKYTNKMNEVKPHYHWARKILLKSIIYGVFHEKQTYAHLLGAREDQNVFV